MVSLYPTLVSDCAPVLDTVCATTLCETLCTPTLCETHFVLCSCVRHTLYSCSCVRQSPLCQTVCALPLCQTLCSAHVRHTLHQCVFHPSDRRSQFVPCPCVIYSLCPAPVSDTALPLCQTHFASETVCIPPL